MQEENNSDTVNYYKKLMSKSSKPGPVNDKISEKIYLYPNIFSSKECKKIIEDFNRFPTDHGTVGKKISGGKEFEYDFQLRKCFVTYAEKDEENNWFHEILENLMLETNKNIWKMDITDFSQPIRLMTYQEGCHFKSLHTDHGPGETSYRKITAIVQLSNPVDYEGGRFELPGETIPEKAHAQGTVIIFPAYYVHRITEITKGVRQSLVYRAIGPCLR